MKRILISGLASRRCPYAYPYCLRKALLAITPFPGVKGTWGSCSGAAIDEVERTKGDPSH